MGTLHTLRPRPGAPKPPAPLPAETKRLIERAIEAALDVATRLIARLDAMDGDADFEADADREADADFEPACAAAVSHGPQIRWAGHDDMADRLPLSCGAPA